MRAKQIIHRDEYIYQRVFDAILEQRLAPGTRLNEEEMAQIFSVSRTVIRKALVRLAHDGVLVSRKNKGTTVTSVTPQEARSIFEARKVTEAAIIGLACGKATDQDLCDLTDLIEQELAAQAAGDNGKALRLSGEFHFKIADIAGNAHLRRFVRNLISRVSLIVAQFESPGQPLCKLQNEHKMLVAALKDRDKQRAESLMLQHVQHIEDKINFNEVPVGASLRAVFDVVNH